MADVSQLHFVGTSSGYDTNHCIHYILAMNVDAELEEPQLLLRHWSVDVLVHGSYRVKHY
jgi:hypothetical protein